MSHCTCPKSGQFYCAWCIQRAHMANFTLPAQRTTPPEESEARFQERLRQMADTYGYLFYHPYDSTKSTPGWPDVALVHPHGSPLFLWELKRQSQQARPSPSQRRWLDALQRATSIHTAVFRPSDWQTMLRLLAQHAGPGAAGATPDGVSG